MRIRRGQTIFSWWVLLLWKYPLGPLAPGNALSNLISHLHLSQCNWYVHNRTGWIGGSPSNPSKRLEDTDVYLALALPGAPFPLSSCRYILSSENDPMTCIQFAWSRGRFGLTSLFSNSANKYGGFGIKLSIFFGVTDSLAPQLTFLHNNLTSNLHGNSYCLEEIDWLTKQFRRCCLPWLQ